MTLTSPLAGRLEQLASPGPRNGRVDGNALELPPYAAIFAKVAP